MPTLPTLIECMERHIGMHEACNSGLSAILGLSTSDENKEALMRVSLTGIPEDFAPPLKPSLRFT